MATIEEQAIEGFRISPQQRRLWQLVQQAGPDAGTPFIGQLEILLEGELDPDRLATALAEVIDLHQSLRTRFSQCPGMRAPLQVISESLERTQLPLTDLEFSVSGQNDELKRIALQERKTPWDLEHGTAVRAQLIRLELSRHVLLLTVSALCADSTSLDVLLKDFAAAYAAPGQRKDGEADVVQYVQFAEWQNQVLEEKADQVAHVPPLPTPSEITATRHAVLQMGESTSDSASIPSPVSTRVLSLNLTRRLDAVASEADVRLEQVLLAAWTLLISRLTQRSSLVVALHAGCRSFEELQTTVGLLEKWLPLRLEFRPGQDWRNFLQQVARQAKQILDWQEHFTWDSLSSGDRPNGTVTCPVGFQFSRLPPPETTYGLRFSLQRRRVTVEPVLLGLHVWEGSSGLELVLEHDETSVPGVVAARLLERLEALLESVCQEPLTAVGRLRCRGPANENRCWLASTAPAGSTSRPPRRCSTCSRSRRGVAPSGRHWCVRRPR